LEIDLAYLWLYHHQLLLGFSYMEEAPSEKQIKYVVDIARNLKLELPENIRTSKKACMKFLDTYVSRYKDFRDSKMNIKKSSGNNTSDVITTVDSKNKSNDPYEQILGYWLDAIKRASFQSLASLPSQLENCSNFSCDKVEYFLNSHQCKDLTNIHDQETVRHLVLRLSSLSTRPGDNKFSVIAIFPLKIVALKESDKHNP
jgi:hypothetical protein